MVEPFKAPRFEMVGKRVAELPFSGTIAAGGFLTIVSSMITYKFRILKVKMIFTEDANNWIVHEWLISGNRSTSTTGRPSGTNIFGRESPVSSFAGKAIVRNIACSIEVREERNYIKLYTRSTSPYAYFVNGTITIEEI